MGSKTFLLWVFVLLIFTDHSQGVPKTKGKSLIVSTHTSAVGEPLTTANPINIPKQHNRPCTCKGKRREMVNSHCRCQQSGRRNGKRQKWEKLCQGKGNKKRCVFKFAPSVPM
ncbi:hypothetical protein EPR50_G00062360 [Perca flavescens]|uniref:Uncharacterized protein n=1 Tax=Perca flavescens TaxID=8167 RepID=A0A484D7Z0_PERFV|nr:hypothetical protein EPR50_G00062360 [Perca flavescens]